MAKSTTEQTLNREAWLNELAEKIVPVLATKGIDLSDVKLRISCSWPGSGAYSATIGECWIPEASGDGTTEVFVSPRIDDPKRVSDILAHELIHASGVHDHRADFAALARAIGLDGKPTATVGGDGFWEWAQPLLDSMPPYPHATLGMLDLKKLKPGERYTFAGPKKQSTRLLKVMCDEGHDPYLARMTRKAIDFGLPICPCGREMIVAE